MTAFAFRETVPAPTMLTAALGNGSVIWTDKEVGKAIKLNASADSAVTHCVEDDEIFGFVGAIAIGTVNQGFSHGSVQIAGWKEAQVGSNQVGAVAVGDYVVADDQVAAGTAGMAKVKNGGTGGWKVMRIVSGTGVAGDTVLLLKI